jgi:DNA (cytosine-5)-methyltransferase 1
MTHGSFFSGIGGFDLAAEWVGWENKFHCEIEPFCQKVLNHYWPDAELFENIKTANFEKYRNKVRVISGGFPCQPYSIAGKRLGKEDDRHLWPFMLEGIRQINPDYVVGENVFGLTSWNEGLVLEEVCLDLENEGYQVQPIIVPAAGVGAPHKRDRIWIVASKNTNKNGWGSFKRKIQSSFGEQWDLSTGDYEWLSTDDEEVGATTDANNTGDRTSERNIITNGSQSSAQWGNSQLESGGHGDKRNVTDSNGERFQGSEIIGSVGEIGQREKQFSPRLLRTNWEEFPTQSPICTGDDGLPSELDGIAVSKWKKQTIMASGNAIVPNIAYNIFQVIQQMDKLTV